MPNPITAAYVDIHISDTGAAPTQQINIHREPNQMSALMYLPGYRVNHNLGQQVYTVDEDIVALKFVRYTRMVPKTYQEYVYLEPDRASIIDALRDDVHDILTRCGITPKTLVSVDDILLCAASPFDLTARLTVQFTKRPEDGSPSPSPIAAGFDFDLVSGSIHFCAFTPAPNKYALPENAKTISHWSQLATNDGSAPDMLPNLTAIGLYCDPDLAHDVSRPKVRPVTPTLDPVPTVVRDNSADDAPSTVTDNTVTNNAAADDTAADPFGPTSIPDLSQKADIIPIGDVLCGQADEPHDLGLYVTNSGKLLVRTGDMIHPNSDYPDTNNWFCDGGWYDYTGLFSDNGGPLTFDEWCSVERVDHIEGDNEACREFDAQGTPNGIYTTNGPVDIVIVNDNMVFIDPAKHESIDESDKDPRTAVVFDKRINDVWTTLHARGGDIASTRLMPIKVAK